MPAVHATRCAACLGLERRTRAGWALVRRDWRNRTRRISESAELCVGECEPLQSLSSNLLARATVKAVLADPRVISTPRRILVRVLSNEPCEVYPRGGYTFQPAFNAYRFNERNQFSMMLQISTFENWLTNL